MGGLGAWWRKRRGGVSIPAAPVHVPDPEADLSIIFGHAAIGIAVSDPSGVLTRANRAFERMLGYEPGELVGKAIAEITHPEDYAKGQELLARVLRGEIDSYQIEKRYRRKDGSIRWGRLVASGVRDTHGKSLYGIGMIEDITEARRIKEQLEYAHRRLKFYIDRAPLAVIVGDSKDVVRAWNPAAQALFGYTAEEAIGRNVYQLIATEEGIEAFRGITYEQEAAQGIVLLCRRKDGSRFHCQWHFTLIRDEPEADTNVIAFASDVSARLRSEEERRALEINLRHAQKMQSLGTLAAGIAHDFNNILLAISGNTKLAMQDLPPDHPAQVSLAEVVKATTRASTVVNQILMFGHREELPQQPVNLRAIVEESLHLLQATFSTRIAIRSNLVAPTPIVLADPAQIQQMLVNLATNAAHAMSEKGGTLTVGLHELEVSEALARKVMGLRPGTYHCITVSDTGIGMPAEVIERIFEPFYTTKQRGQATGLGLSVVHGIVRAHGGAIEVQSTPGAGSTFRVYLPAIQAQLPAAAPATARRERGEGQRILYLDDEEPLVYLITRVLQRLGYQVEGFIDSSVALETFRQNPQGFDAVVTDLSMPGMPGTEFARQVLAIRPELPVVMTSGYVRPEDRDQALALGVRELLLKPNTVEALGEVLHRLLQRAREAS